MSDITNKEAEPQMNRSERRRKEKLERSQPMRVRAWLHKARHIQEKRAREKNAQRRIDERRNRKQLAHKILRAPVEGIAQAHLERRESRYAEPVKTKE